MMETIKKAFRQRTDNRIYRELKKLNSPQINEPIKK
jgi:hypothetical protein